MKKLHLKATDKDLYSLFYTALNNPDSRLDKREMRVLGKMLDATEELGTKDAQRGYVFADQECVLLLEEDQHALAQRMASDTKWLAGAARQVVALYDWLEKAEDYTPPKPELVKDEEPSAPATS